jgi:hypothetical protein
MARTEATVVTTISPEGTPLASWRSHPSNPDVNSVPSTLPSLRFAGHPSGAHPTVFWILDCLHRFRTAVLL